jgi:hypothetical protein
VQEVAGHAFYARNHYGPEQDYVESCYDHSQKQPELGLGVEEGLFDIVLETVFLRDGASSEYYPSLRAKQLDGKTIAAQSSHLLPLDTTWAYHLFIEERWIQIRMQRAMNQKEALFVKRPTVGCHL